MPAPYEDKFVSDSYSNSKEAGKKHKQSSRKHRIVPSEITVKEGETLYVIARRYGIPLREVIELNHLKPPYMLYKGQKLKLPKSKHHVVKKGETLSHIALLYGVRLSALVQENNLKPPYTLYVDQVLKLPGAVEKDRSKPKIAEAQGKRAKKGSTSSKEQGELIPLPSLDGLENTSETIPLPSLEGLENKIDTAPLEQGTEQDKKPLLKEKSLPLKKIEVKLPPRSQGKFLKPVKGNIVLDYGSKGGGIHNDGINISAAEGAPIQAAENGVVVYTGSGIESFGNLTLIKHSGRWISAYGHASKILVKRGDQVKRGQVIAFVGKTGFVKTPQLHFELRKGSETVDPNLYL